MVHARSLIYGGHISEPTAPRDLLIMSQFFSAYLTARGGPTKYWLININDDPNPHSNPRQLEYVLLIAAGPGWPTWDRWDRLQLNHNPDGLMDGWTFRQSKKIIIHIFIIKIWFAILQSVELVYSYHVWWLSPQGLIWSVYMFLD